MKNSRIKRPNPILYFGLGFFIQLGFKLYYKLKINRSIKKINQPCLVVVNHASWIDYLIVFSSMFPVRMNYVGAYNFFRDKKLIPLLKSFGVISKYQFTNDIVSIKQMKRVVDQGGVVTIFPNGCLSNDGREGGYAVFGIAKLAKFLKVPVVRVQINGGYFTRPRYTKHSFRGKIEVNIDQILNVDDLNKSEEELYCIIKNGIHFDDYAWQRENRVKFKGQNRAEGLEYVLYKCPNCNHEFTLTSNKNSLSCTHCEMEVVRDEYGFFQSRDNKKFYEGLDEWFDFQKENLQSEIQNDSFSMSTKTKLFDAPVNEYGYRYVSTGEITINKEEVVYIDQNNTYHFPMKNIIMVPYAAGEYIEISSGSEIHRFVFENKNEKMKWVQAIRQIRDTYYEKEIYCEKTR